MVRGTTPIHVFTSNISLEDIDLVYITYKQKDVVILEKTIEDVEIEDNKIRVKLTQENTLRFAESLPVEIQIRLKYIDGCAIASNIIRTSAERILKDGEI